MHTESIERWLHDHTFGQEERKAGEARTLIVIGITAVTMGLEIAAGMIFGSMALLADGLHMGSHAAALAIAAFAYYYTRRHARDERFNFGTGKVNSLAAFASAMLLIVFALVMVWESVGRLASPVEIEFNQAILVAVLGLGVNGVCLVILGGHGHSSEEEHERTHEEHDHEGAQHEHHRPQHEDHNLLAAYVHVLTDALTSFLAIFALLFGKYLGATWLDPAVGLLGGALILRWSLGLTKVSTHVLLDMDAPGELSEAIREAIEAESDNRVVDLHAWAVGPGIYATEVSVVTSEPRNPDDYWDLLPKGAGLMHATFEVHLCEECRDAAEET